jgi:hypothetical protein
MTFLSAEPSNRAADLFLYQERQDALDAVGLSEQDAHADS